MNADNLSLLPVWKKDSSAEEFFGECSLLARKYPERFGKVALVYEETLATGRTITRTASRALNTNELVGILAIGISDIIANSQK